MIGGKGLELHPEQVVQSSNVPLRLRKSYTKPKLQTHTVLTDDAFSYVDFFFKKHPKKVKDENGKVIKQNYIFYWKQANNFYNAAKILPIESAPLPMYYSMLNAMKAYILYCSENPSDALKSLNSHGLNEHNGGDANAKKDLSSIYVKKRNNGVFTYFSKMIDSDINEKWPQSSSLSVKELMSNLSFIYNSYIATYDLKRKDERFIPLKAGSVPNFRYCNDRKIHLVAEVQRDYFKSDATSIPKEIAISLENHFEFSSDNPFDLISKEAFKKSEISGVYSKYRKMFSFISSEKKLWYIDENAILGNNSIPAILCIVAITHRFSEIVRYKPEEMERLLSNKENWLIHEFLSLALDQFVDEISCEITKHDIMKTRYK